MQKILQEFHVSVSESAQWDVQLLSKVVRESFPSLDFTEVVKLLDSPNLEVVSPQCLSLLLPLFLLLLKQGLPNDWLYSLWKNPSGPEREGSEV